MRLAGTCSRYSNRAMPQLISAAMYHGDARSSLRCAYHAKVMKRLERPSRIAVLRMTGMALRYGNMGTWEYAKLGEDFSALGPSSQIPYSHILIFSYSQTFLLSHPEQIAQLQEEPVRYPAHVPERERLRIRQAAAIAGEQHGSGCRLVG